VIDHGEHEGPDHHRRRASADTDRLARECAKLDRAEEQALANEILAAESEWPVY
jgi:hypothetical protein